MSYEPKYKIGDSIYIWSIGTELHLLSRTIESIEIHQTRDGELFYFYKVSFWDNPVSEKAIYAGPDDAVARAVAAARGPSL